MLDRATGDLVPCNATTCPMGAALAPGTPMAATAAEGEGPSLSPGGSENGEDDGEPAGATHVNKVSSAPEPTHVLLRVELGQASYNPTPLVPPACSASMPLGHSAKHPPNHLNRCNHPCRLP